MMSAETSRLDLTVKQGLQKLIEGNQRFMRGEARCPTVCKETLANLARGQHRYALPMPLPRNSPLSCRGFDNFESELGGFRFEALNLELPMLSFVEGRSTVFHPIAQYALDQAG